MCHPWVIEVYRNRDGLWSKLQDTVLAIFVDVDQDMGPILQ